MAGLRCRRICRAFASSTNSRKSSARSSPACSRSARRRARRSNSPRHARVVLEHARLKYRCEDFEGASTVRTATAHPSPLPRSNAGPGLLAHVLVSKYGDGLPLARQERIFTRHGAVLSRKTLCDWVLAACELLGRLRAPLHQHILGAPVVFSDDTTLKLRTEEVRGRSVTARLWGYVSAGWQRNESDARVDYPKAVLYEFTEDRRGEHPQRFLARYRGYLQADDYAGYHGLFRSRRVYHAACWAHARRGFFDIARKDATPGLAQQALDWIRQIYRVEREIRGRPPDERQRERQQRTRPLLDRFRQWLTGIERDLLPRGPMAIAVRYVLRTGARCCVSPASECSRPTPTSSSVACARSRWVGRPGFLRDRSAGARRPQRP
ncbi:MAG: IS66 family transposase [Burkholderiaceae bacterium]|nr:IS66 family transposase [Burkholderiaceae bacterium]